MWNVQSDQAQKWWFSPGGEFLAQLTEAEKVSVRDQLISKAINHGAGGAWGTFFAILGIAAIHGVVHGGWLNLPWLIGMLFITGMRLGGLLALSRQFIDSTTQMKERVFLIPLVLTSLGWAVLPILVFPEAPAVEQLALVCVLSGLAGGSATLLASLKWTARLYLVSVLLPGSVLLYGMSATGPLLSFLGLCFLGTMLIAHSKLHQETIQAVLQLVENRRLLDSAKLHHDEVELLNQALRSKQESLLEHNAELSQEVAARARSMMLAYAVVNHTAEGVMVMSPDGMVVEVNPAFSDITGYSPADIIGATAELLHSDRYDAKFFADIRHVLREKGMWAGELWSRRKDGSLFLERRVLDAVRDEKGKLTHYISIFSDVTDHHAKDERLRVLAFHDALTGLANRSLLQDRLNLGVVQAKRREKRMAVLYFDLDHFKAVNDSLGHHVGDVLLQTVADRLRQCVRASDTLARLGGDEFVVLLNDVEEVQHCAQVADKLISVIGQPLELQGVRMHVRTSLGIAIFPDDGEDAEALLKCADMAMYSAKNGGRHTFRFFHNGLSEQARQRMEMETALREALEHDHFCVYYQPKVAALGGHIVGYEALLRWPHADWGLVPPDRFIPVAEDAGLIGAIGAEVVRKVCAQLAAWHQAGHGWQNVAINVSAKQLMGRDLVELIQDAVSQYAVPYASLELEITESAVLTNPGHTLDLLEELRALGVTVAVDDFGTGQSSLAYLRRLPIDVVKIDRAFVQDLEHDPQALAVVQLIVALSRTLSLKTVAEGVETEQQADFLRASGCDVFQGFLFAKPQPAHLLEWGGSQKAASEAMDSARQRVVLMPQLDA